jgi:hypothetical protein
MESANKRMTCAAQRKCQHAEMLAQPVNEWQDCLKANLHHSTAKTQRALNPESNKSGTLKCLSYFCYLLSLLDRGERPLAAAEHKEQTHAPSNLMMDRW